MSQEQSARVVQAMHESELYAMETDQAAHASQVASRRADQTLRAAIQEAAAEAAKQAPRAVMLEGSGARDGARDLRRPDGRYESGYESGSKLGAYRARDGSVDRGVRSHPLCFETVSRFERGAGRGTATKPDFLEKV